MFSVDTEEEAQRLCTLACGTNLDGDYVATELALAEMEGRRTIADLIPFSDRLQRAWDFLNKRK